MKKIFSYALLKVNLTHLDGLHNDDGSKSTEYGVNGRSILMDYKYFDACQCLVPDVMHDILEGALQYELKLLLVQLIMNAKYFSVSTCI